MIDPGERDHARVVCTFVRRELLDLRIELEQQRAIGIERTMLCCATPAANGSRRLMARAGVSSSSAETFWFRLRPMPSIHAAWRRK
ncbi:hypothetical protein BSFP_041630 [Burkholderia stabilis]|uniref:Uncharacterized protein n=1 Tax=Burkholderia stabilis TaxID=95485 RepID=A0A1Y1BQB1_9BURK|nr:hypothetical protein BSFP_041630 [Burkholderia stabilis]